MKKDPIYKPVKSFENYSISDAGTLKKDNKVLFVGNNTGKAKYLSCPLRSSGQNYSEHIHRLVAKYFIPNPENKKYVIHLNHNNYDNRAENLSWATAAEVINHGRKKKLAKEIADQISTAKVYPVDRPHLGKKVFMLVLE